MYQLATNSWEAISHMTAPRTLCLAALLPDNQLIIMGGFTTENKKCDLVKFGTELLIIVTLFPVLDFL